MWVQLCVDCGVLFVCACVQRRELWVFVHPVGNSLARTKVEARPGVELEAYQGRTDGGRDVGRRADGRRGLEAGRRIAGLNSFSVRRF